ncbi:MAG: hypothetical protein RBR97_01535 [Bacteroidales bacterium]|nr:hypothetical protein [Bacteroidales bacterium]
MQNINTSEQLMAAIQKLELEQQEKGILLKVEAVEAIEKFNPLNLLTNVLEDSTASPVIIDKMLKSAFQICSEYITGKVSGGEQSNMFRKMLGTLLKSGLTSIRTNNMETFKSISQYIYLNVFKKQD